MKRILLFILFAALAGCASVRKVESGTNMVGTRMQVTIEGPWNHLDFPGIKPAQVWTMEGITVDELMIYSGIRDGEQMHPPGGPKSAVATFRKDLSIEKLVSMFEATLSRDGSTVKLTKVQPIDFGGEKGVRFEYERIRKFDNVQQLGFGYAAISNDELFALVYQAPRLTFFPRHRERVEQIARSVAIKS